MEVGDVIKQRRSVRSFLPKEIDRSTLVSLIEAGIWAPSGSNIQPWHFIIVTEALQVEKIKSFTPGLLTLPPALMAICTDLDLETRRGGRMGREVLSLMDSALAAQNIALTAVDLGLATCLIRSFNADALREILGLPAAIQPQLLVAIGYPEKIPQPPKRRKLDEVISWEIYGKAGEVS